MAIAMDAEMKAASQWGLVTDQLGVVTRELARTRNDVAALQMDATKSEARSSELSRQLELLRAELERAATSRRRDDDAALQGTLQAVSEAVQRERRELAVLATEAAQSAGKALERVGHVDVVEAELQELRRRLDEEVELRAQALDKVSQVAEQSLQARERETQECLAQLRQELQLERDQRAALQARWDKRHQEHQEMLDHERAAREQLRSGTAEALATAQRWEASACESREGQTELRAGLEHLGRELSRVERQLERTASSEEVHEWILAASRELKSEASMLHAEQRAELSELKGKAVLSAEQQAELSRQGQRQEEAQSSLQQSLLEERRLREQQLAERLEEVEEQRRQHATLQEELAKCAGLEMLQGLEVLTHNLAEAVTAKSLEHSSHMTGLHLELSKLVEEHEIDCSRLEAEDSSIRVSLAGLDVNSKDAIAQLMERLRCCEEALSGHSEEWRAQHRELHCRNEGLGTAQERNEAEFDELKASLEAMDGRIGEALEQCRALVHTELLGVTEQHQESLAGQKRHLEALHDGLDARVSEEKQKSDAAICHLLDKLDGFQRVVTGDLAKYLAAPASSPAATPAAPAAADARPWQPSAQRLSPVPTRGRLSPSAISTVTASPPAEFCWPASPPVARATHTIS